MKKLSSRKKGPSDPLDRYIYEATLAGENYMNDVETGKITASKFIIQAVARSRADRKRTDIEFRTKAVERVYKFFSFLRIKNGKKYTQFILSPFQAWILSEIFGWYYLTGVRRYRYALIYTARKSGKTVFCVAIQLYMLMYDGEADTEAYLCATTREQAGQGLRYVKNMVKNSPAMKSRLKVQQFQIVYPKKSGLLKVLANKPEANDSLNPYVFILDEMHAHKTLDFYNVMKSGTMSRENPLGIITSTAGFNKDYPFFLMVETAKQVLDGNIQDDITFIALYALDDEDDVEDSKVWIKANPNIGVTIRLDALEKEWEKAKLTITEKNNFITKNLNRYLDNNDQWIPDDIYVTGFRDATMPQGINGNKPIAYAGIDLSSTRDLASFVLKWEDPVTGRHGVIPEFYFPQNEVKRVRKSGIDLGTWIEKGYIIEHPTATIDQKLILERIKYWNTIFDIRQLNYDKWNSGFIIPEIESTLFINCQHFNQTPIWYNIPLRWIEKLFFEETVDMSSNPVLRWMFRNIVLWKDGNGNIKIMKNKSQDSVDGPVAYAMAEAAWLQNNNDATAEFFKGIMGGEE